MSAHPDLRPLIDGDEPDAEVRRELLLHLECCGPCRAEFAEAAPERLFSLLDLEPMPDGVLERVSAGVSTGIDLEEARRPARRRLAWGSLAASLMLAGVLGHYLWKGTREAPLPPAAVNRMEPPAAVAAETAVPASMIEVHAPGSADVVQVTVGDTELVMIFDEALDL